MFQVLWYDKAARKRVKAFPLRKGARTYKNILFAAGEAHRGYPIHIVDVDSQHVASYTYESFAFGKGRREYG